MPTRPINDLVFYFDIIFRVCVFLFIFVIDWHMEEATMTTAVALYDIEHFDFLQRFRAM